MDKDTFEVTVKGGGDPETFVAKEVEIVVNGYERFVITPGKIFGLNIRSPKASALTSANNTRDEIVVYETYD